MTIGHHAAVLCAFGAAACMSAPPDGVREPPTAASESAPPPANATVLPAGTDLQVTLNQSVGAESHRRGDTFTVSVVEPIVALNGATVVESGAVLTGMVTGIAVADSVGDQAAIRLNFLRIELDGITHPLSAIILETDLSGAADPDELLTAAGTARGVVITGDLREALITSGLGVGAGTIVSLGTGTVPAVLAADTRFTIRTIDRLELR